MRKSVIIAGLILVLQLALAPLYCENFNAKSWQWQSCIETTSTDYNFAYGKCEMAPSSSVVLQGDEIKEVKGHDTIYIDLARKIPPFRVDYELPTKFILT